MSNFVIIMQARKNLYFIPIDEKEPPMPFRLKGDLLKMVGARTNRAGYHPIEYSDENFRFFIPADMLQMKVAE